MQQKQINYDFGWGNPYFLLDILSNHYVGFSTPDIHKFTYGPYEGLPGLIEETHKTIKSTTGHSYKHILITNGASNGINMLLRELKSRGVTTIHTTKYGYPSYEMMISRAGLDRVRDLNSVPPNIVFAPTRHVRLIDSPENPMGEQFVGGDENADIWDGVYHNNIYTRHLLTQPRHRYFVGSYTKLLGIAGARVGFIATDDTQMYHDLLAQSHNELCGVSRPSQELLVDILKKVDLFHFMNEGERYLGYNKEEFQKIEYLFDGQPVNEVGMFYCAKADPKVIDLLDKVGVSYVQLDSDTIRLSMGQYKDVTKNGIRAILKKDGK